MRNKIKKTIYARDEGVAIQNVRRLWATPSGCAAPTLMKAIFQRVNAAHTGSASLQSPDGKSIKTANA